MAVGLLNTFSRCISNFQCSPHFIPILNRKSLRVHFWQHEIDVLTCWLSKGHLNSTADFRSKTITNRMVEELSTDYANYVLNTNISREVSCCALWISDRINYRSPYRSNRFARTSTKLFYGSTNSSPCWTWWRMTPKRHANSCHSWRDSEPSSRTSARGWIHSRTCCVSSVRI